MFVLDQNVKAEEWADTVWNETFSEYDRAKAAIRSKLETALNHITVTELLHSVAEDNPKLSSRSIRSALADLRGSLFYLESDGRIVAPRSTRPTHA